MLCLNSSVLANVALAGLLRVYSILVFLLRQLVASFDFCWNIGACSVEALGFALHWSRSWRGCRGTGRLCEVRNCFCAGAAVVVQDGFAARCWHDLH